MEMIFQEPYDYTFSKARNSQLILALCGSVGSFELDIVLNQHETEEYNKNGKPFIDNLAGQIRYRPTAWTDRKIN